ncbi:hypothetical protein JXR93_02025 [bacterium]|nr:hypothetical protein [bacterium]
MRVARDDFRQYVYKLLEAMKNNQINNEFIKRVVFLESNVNIYNNLLNERVDLKVQRIEATEALAKTESSLIKLLRSTNSFVKSLILSKDAKYREFVQTGKLSDILNSKKGVFLDGVKYYLNGLKRNIDLGVSENIIVDFEKSINDFELAFKNSELIKQNETASVIKLKEFEAKFKIDIRKLSDFVKSQIDSSEHHVYFYNF